MCHVCESTGFYGSRNWNDVSKHMEKVHRGVDPEDVPYWLMPFREGKLRCVRDESVLMPDRVEQCSN